MNIEQALERVRNAANIDVATLSRASQVDEAKLSQMALGQHAGLTREEVLRICEAMEFPPILLSALGAEEGDGPLSEELRAELKDAILTLAQGLEVRAAAYA